MREREKTVLLRAGKAIERMGLRWRILRFEPPIGARRADALLELTYPGGKVELLAEIKTRPSAPLVHQIARPGGDSYPRLLVADYVNPGLAERLRRSDVSFVDAAGNAYLRQGALYIWVTGMRDALRLEVERERRRAFQPSGLKLVFALLCRPELAEADYRTIAETAGVALGTTQWVMRDLIREGYVLRLGRFKRRLVKPKELLDAWLPSFVRDLRPRLLLGRFEATQLGWWRNADLRTHGGLWGGEPAAALLTKHLKPGALTIYADEIPARLVVREHLRKNEEGRIDFRKKFWRFDAEEGKGETVPPVLVYADLIAIAEPRARETADRVYKEMIDGPFQAHLARWLR
jgi:hypothetical protein